jgi:hypothetical protein
MSSAQIIARLAENTVALAKAKVERNEQVEALDKQIAVLEQEAYELNICLQIAETDEAFYATEHKERTKLKWVSSTNPDTYSVAVVKKDGILEVKRVTDGGGHCHDTTLCQCIPCSEIRLSDRLGVPRPPWRARTPLLMTFYETEAAWLASLPARGAHGSVKVTVPTISDRKLKRLSCTPLSGTNDALKLKEIQERFPGGTIVFNTGKQFLEIEHLYQDIATYPEDWCHLIRSKEQERSVYNFLDLADPPRPNGKPQLMAEWNGLYIDLSHLF